VKDWLRHLLWMPVAGLLLFGAVVVGLPDWDYEEPATSNAGAIASKLAAWGLLLLVIQGWRSILSVVISAPADRTTRPAFVHPPGPLVKLSDAAGFIGVVLVVASVILLAVAVSHSQ
jgi:hypothetical protein